ncbi:MAG TPA: tetratricopeptide repeat protein [Pseudonocardiaceae bacterium]
MIARPSPFGVFTRRGRLRNGWAKALAQPDPAVRLARLRSLFPRFGEKPKLYADLWAPFLDSVLRGTDPALLAPADLAALEDIGFALTAPPAPPLTRRDALGPLLSARDLLRQPQAAIALLTRMYRAPEVPPQERTAIAKSLAARGARDDAQLAIYVEQLQEHGTQSAPPNLLALLTGGLTTGFELNPAQIQRAGALAHALHEARVRLPGIELALGYANLLVSNDFPAAIRYFQTALDAYPADLAAFFGLVSGLTRHGDHEQALAAITASPHPRIAELGELSAMLVWLTDPIAPGPAPATVARLTELNVRMLAGDWLGFAIARAHLLAGNAPQAAELLTPLAEAHPERPEWHYHAAWARALLGDAIGVGRHFLGARGWSGRWTVGCLLLDADPALADEVATELEQHPPPEQHAPVLRTRLALARRERAGLLPWPPVDRPLPEALESLRTMLGQRLTGAPTPLIDDIVRAMVAHLPLADQLLWTGLSALSNEDGRGRAALDRAAHQFRYPRAALVLAVHNLEEGRYAEADELLARFTDRTDPDFQVLHAWARTRTDDSVAELERLAASGNSRAHYALGSIHIGQTRARQAAEEFRAALADPDRPVPADTAVLARCAQLIDTGDAVPDQSVWAAVQELPAARGTPWLRWHAALAQLVDEPTVEVAEYLVAQVESMASAPRAVPRALGRMLAHAALTTDLVINDLLTRLSRLRSDPELDRLQDLAGAAIQRAGGPAAPDNGSVEGRFVTAERALLDLDRASAAKQLRLVPADDEPVGRAGLLLADLLEDRAISADAVIDVPDGLPPATTMALRVTNAAVLATHDQDASIAALIPMLADPDLRGLVDLRRSLPLVCAQLGRSRQRAETLAELIIWAAGADPALSARCATAIGNFPLANRLWEQARALGDAPAETRAEYVRFLNHQAVLAQRKGEHWSVVHRLSLVARIDRGHPLDQLVPTATELAELTSAVGTIVAGQPDADEWRVTSEQAGSALANGDEPQALLLVSRLENLLTQPRRGES